MKGYFKFPKAPGLEPYHQMVLVSYPDKSLGWGGLNETTEREGQPYEGGKYGITILSQFSL